MSRRKPAQPKTAEEKAAETAAKEAKKAERARKRAEEAAARAEYRKAETERLRAQGLWFTRAEARALIEEVAGPITGPVRFVQPPVPQDWIPDSDIEPIMPNKVWLSTHRDPATGKTKKVKVEWRDDQSWTCNCGQWINRRTIDCIDIASIKRKLGIGNPFRFARRRGPTYYFFPQHTPQEHKRRKDARNAEAALVPQMLADLCALLAPGEKRTGRRGLTTAAAAYALGVKVYFDQPYADLRHTLLQSPYLRMLGWSGAAAPDDDTLSRGFGQDALVDATSAMIAPSSYPCAEMDDVMLGDSHDVPAYLTQNSLDEKFAKIPSTRTKRVMVRQHFAVGAWSNVVYALDTTLNAGVGAGDATHQPRLAARQLQIAPNGRKHAWDRAYGTIRNFFRCEELGIELFVVEKFNEKRQDEHWPESARRQSRLQKEDFAAFHEISRMRPKAEGTPSRIKRRKRKMDLRPRKHTDPVVNMPAEIDDDEKLSALPEEVIDAVLDAAGRAVGNARRSESAMTIVVANLRQLVLWSYFCDQSVDFRNRSQFRPIPTIHAVDLLEAKRSGVRAEPEPDDGDVA